MDNFHKQMKEGAIDKVIQGDEIIVAFGFANWYPKSIITKLIDDSFLQATVMKQYIVCLTNKRFLMLELPKFKNMWKISFDTAELTHSLHRGEIRAISLGRPGLISRTRELTIIMGKYGETTLKFFRQSNQDAEKIFNSLPQA